MTYDEWLDALAEKQSRELTLRFREARVAVCGAGGLGSNISIMLARAGVGHLDVFDFDDIEITNLNRQQYLADQIGMPKAEALKENISKIAPFCDVSSHIMKLDDTNMDRLFDGADIICEAFDKADAKAMLVNFVLENYSGKYLVAGSGMAGTGPAGEIVTRKITPRFFICGDGQSDVDETGVLLGSRVMICAAHQAHTVLRIIAGEETP